MVPRLSHRLLLAYAALNAVLYSMLLPLWEGFDEPFHFGYVQQFANGQGFPDARNARLSQEVWQSILLAPASEPVKSNLPRVTTYSEYFFWPAERRSQIQQALREIPRDQRAKPSDGMNYESLQAPLAYTPLAVAERLLANAALPKRVLLLRIAAALAGVLLLFAATCALSAELALAAPYRDLVLFCLLSAQMTWATLAHVANDWLAVPLAVWTLVFLIRAASFPSVIRMTVASVVLAAGLLTKAYFLALVPVLFAIAALRGKLRGLAASVLVLAACAGPWYIRNWRLYHALTGTQEERAGLGPVQVVHAAFALDWPRVALTSVRGALWTANNTFRSFSVPTMNVLIALCAAALLLWIFSRHARREWIVAAYCAAFVLADAYTAVETYIRTHNPFATPSAWYAQVLVAPLWVLVFLGAARHPKAGKVLAPALALLSGYILAATYIVKLIPLYAGFEGRASLKDLAAEYFMRFPALRGNLNCVALGSATWIFSLTLTVAALIVVLEIALIRGILAWPKSSWYSAPAPRPLNSAPSS
jgi:hypothetical protein